MKAILAFLILFLCPFVVAQQLPDAPQPHRFLDKTNKVLIGGSALSLMADAFSGESDPSSSYEINPILRPLAQSRSGTAVYFGASLVLETGTMYWLHRHHHHRLERLLPMVVIPIETYWTINNSRLSLR